MKVLVACEFSGIVRDAFREEGCDAWSCDLIPCEANPKYHIQCDVLEVLNNGWDLMIAHPPCTYLTFAGNKWFAERYKDRFPNRLKKQKEALEFVRQLLIAPIKRICLENPYGVISCDLKKHDQVIHPYYFGDPSRKRTCLWLKNLPRLKYYNKTIVKPELVLLNNGKVKSKFELDSLRLRAEERIKFRERTFKGIATAMAKQWGHLKENECIGFFQ